MQIEHNTFNMHNYIQRDAEEFLILNLKTFPAIVILGPRQCGKSTLAKTMLQSNNTFLYLDLQNYMDLAKLNDLNLFFKSNADSVVCIDEVQLKPDLFAFLRSEIDSDRRNGRFILLGSASQQLIQKTSESLAGRAGLISLTPFTYFELKKTEGFSLQKHWFRGGFPDSYLAETGEMSALWLENYIKTYIERDIPQLGIQIPALQMRRFLMMLGHWHGQTLNLSKIGESLGVSHTTIRRYLDLLEQTFIIRTVPVYEPNLKKRLVKSPKLYFRDSGLLHHLLGITDFNQLLAHPVLGASWEGYVIENLLTHFKGYAAYFYRSASGHEVDLVLENNTDKFAIECKTSSDPSPTKGFWKAIEAIMPSKSYIVIPAENNYKLTENVLVTSMDQISL